VTNIDWSKIGAVTVKRDDGYTQTYGSLLEALNGCTWKFEFSKANIYGRFRDVGWTLLSKEAYRFGRGDRYLILDEVGLVIPRWRIDEEAKKSTSYYFRPVDVYRYGVIGYEPYGPYWRNGPVYSRKQRKPGKHSGFGKTKARKRAGIRRERSQQERSIAYLLQVDEEAIEFGIKVRRNRGLEKMDWDRRLRKMSANWKRYRKTQYKIVID